MGYKGLYLHLMRQCETARRQLAEAEQTIIQAQRWCEEQYIAQSEEDKTHLHLL